MSTKTQNKRFLKSLWILPCLFFWLFMPLSLQAQVGEDEEATVINHDVVRMGENLTIDEHSVVMGDVMVMGGNATIAGEINGDVTVMGGNAAITNDVNGDLVLFGGNVTLDGTVNGDVVVTGGNLTWGATAAVTGECTVIGSVVHSNDEESEAGLQCTNVSDPFVNSVFANFSDINFTVPEVPDVPPVPTSPELPEAPPIPVVHEEGSSWGSIIGRSLMYGFIALVLAAIFPAHIERVNHTLKEKPITSGLMGMLTAIAGTSLWVLIAVISSVLLIICIGILGFPILAILGFVMGFATLMGWIAIGDYVGDKLGQTFNLNSSRKPLMTALGTVVLTLAVGAVSGIGWEFVGWSLSTALLCIGLGATALTKFGSRAYPVTDSGTPNVDVEKEIQVLDTLPKS